MKHLEIENKYLLSHKKAVDFIKTLTNYSTKDIKQIYFAYSTKSTKRVRKVDDKYILTVKKGDGKVREEYKKEITKKRYKKFKKKKIGRVIKKRRYVFELDGYTYELDIFKGSLKGLAYLEVEFNSIEKMKNFTLPESLQKIVKKDVSGDRRYTNAFLAVSIKEYKNIGKIFKKIEKNPKKFKFKPKEEINIYDCLRVWLYRYMVLAKNYAFDFTESDNEEDLHQFRVNIRRIRSLLYSFREIFSEDIYKKLNSSLKYIAQKTNLKRDIDVFLISLEKDKEFYESLYHYLKNEQTFQKNEIEIFIQSDKFKDILFDLEAFLKDGNGFYANTYAYLPAKTYTKMSFKKLYKKIKKSSSNLTPLSPIDKFHKIRIKIKKLRYLVETFSYFIKEKSVKQTLKILQESFGNLNDTHKQIIILRNFLQKYPNDMTAQKLLKKLELNLQNIKVEICSKSAFNL